MAIIKCKMCGGDIELSADKTFGTCEYCGSTMTLPKVDDDQRAAAFNRGNHFRRIGEFDKALAVYERIVQEDDTDAEAHWCCALCRFGIEYVEDPATYEWLPTCHRASFDSFLEDVDYLAALKYSDGVTRRQYQKDGAKIAEVQRGILATSQHEEPFDVFICYKETDDNGNRTKDSIIAQDIYYQLTEQGRRVFFARITLEDKAGAQFEPYIFAALHSARVMIVVGTSPEHFNAVWVKNEWSRFLSLMKKDRHKLLLPCYRDMDPYDLPEQLSVLQSYDMSKIGFIQDLNRGVAKVLDAEKKPEVLVAAPAPGGSNASALLKRGDMALEDGEWEKADGFYEEVLNQNAECAEAYLGKALAASHCKSLDDYVQGLLKQTKGISAEKLQAIERSDVHIYDAIQKYRIPGHLEERDIAALYNYDLTYSSVLSYWKIQIQQADQTFSANKLIGRALRFASGNCKTKLEKAKRDYVYELKARAAEAEKADAASIERVRSAYAKHLKEADEQVKQLHQQILQQQEQQKAKRLEQQAKLMEQDYQVACSQMNLARTYNDFTSVKHRFLELGNYKDSAKLMQLCQEKEKKCLTAIARKKRIKVCLCLAAVLAIAAIPLVELVIKPSITYKQAERLLESGDYEGAEKMFASLGEYKDAEENARYAEAEAFLEAGNYDSAAWRFGLLGDYRDAAERVLMTRYAEAEALLESGNHLGAARAFEQAGDYLDASERSAELMDAASANWNSIAAGANFTLGLKTDGTVIAVGNNDYGQCEVSDWSDIVSVAAGYEHAVGLRADGTVVAVGKNDFGQCNVSDWTDIVAVAAGPWHTVGLKADGSAITVGGDVSHGYNIGEVEDVSSIYAGYCHTIYLKSDGEITVQCESGDLDHDASDWTDIVATAIRGGTIFGLKSDGTVLTDPWQDLSGWSDIVAISANYEHVVGLKSNGAVVAAGNNEYGQCDVSGWSDIVAISAGSNCTIGLKSDGSLVAVGNNEYGQCDVSGWTDIKLP